ncbi:DUF1120 domain-containing protein [Leclercia adecarboxylata]|uniref:DUF1120 domain-containing protein n=1 Tax=Leclercia adecarboxylata TaxID=83655 RepID=UPI002DB98845|nr:DUF1120 domain-containing protein [Leclercia adecarboxylata]MEB6380714.1 DUF1120 domain-containing protein [Leclercia adecarboxylata]
MTQFKKTLSTLGVCAALMMAAQVNAATETTLKVTGTIVPAACSPSLSNGGEVSFGSIAAASIRNAAEGNSLVQLGTKDVTLTITCEANAAVGFKMMDNRASSAVALSSTAFINPSVSGITPATNDYLGFGLGLASNGAKIGAYTVMLDSANVVADGESVATVWSDDSGKNWTAGENVRQVKDNMRIMTVAAKSSTAEPKMFKEATMPLKISAGVQTTSVLGGDEITLDGNATLSLVYL